MRFAVHLIRRQERDLTVIASSVIRHHPLDEECTERVFAKKEKKREGVRSKGGRTKWLRILCDGS